jgi:hypothetical protein
MSEDDYRECCRCWQVYLDRIGDEHRGMTGRSEGEFPRRIREKLPDVTAWAWPTVWPHVQQMFAPRDRETGRVDWEAGTRLFVEAVRFAEQADRP